MFRRTDLCLPDGACRLDIDDDGGFQKKCAYGDLLAKRQRLSADWEKFCSRNAKGSIKPIVVPFQTKL